MNCTVCHLYPSRTGTDRCARCAGIYLVRLSGEARKALAAIMARHPGLTVDQAISSCLIMHDHMHNQDEAGAE